MVGRGEKFQNSLFKTDIFLLLDRSLSSGEWLLAEDSCILKGSSCIVKESFLLVYSGVFVGV